VFEAFVIIWGDIFADGEENVDESCHSKPALSGSERNMLVGYQSRNRRLTGLDVYGDLPMLESDPQGDDGDKWCDSTI
jgi:hypothetical protein